MNRATVNDAVDAILEKLQTIEAEFDNYAVTSLAAEAKCVGPRSRVQRARSLVESFTADLRDQNFD